MMNALIEKIMRRKRAYRRVFLDGDGNLGPEAKVVMDDLRRFCRASSSTAVVSPISKTIDPLAMAMAEGRREVFNRIAAHLYVNEKQVFELNESGKDDL